MTTEVATKKGGLPANIMNMAQSLAKSVSATSGAGSDKYMKMDKTGVFVFGAENIEPEEESLWAVNPMGCLHGWVAWGTKAHDTEGKNVGEMMVPAAQPLPNEGELPDVKGEWSKAAALQLRCTNGEDEGIQVLFKSNSVGGLKAYSEVLGKIVARITEGETDVVPLVSLTSDSYKHAKYGKIFFPIFSVEKWVSMDGEPADEAPAEKQESAAPPATKQEDQPEAEEVPRRRRRKAS